jgi:hypothetical protein
MVSVLKIPRPGGERFAIIRLTDKRGRWHFEFPKIKFLRYLSRIDTHLFHPCD